MIFYIFLVVDKSSEKANNVLVCLSILSYFPTLSVTQQVIVAFVLFMGFVDKENVEYHQYYQSNGINNITLD